MATTIERPAAGERADAATRQPRLPGQGRHTLSRLALYALLSVFGVIAAVPFVWMILGSFKTGAELRQTPPTFWPQDPTLANYETILSDPDLPLALFYRNSLFVAVTVVIATLFTSSLLGYVFAKYEFRGRQPLFWFVLATMMIPAQVTMIPAYLILVQLGLLNNLWGLVLPSFVDAFGIFLMRQFMFSIPDDEIWSARVDGASEWRIYRSVVLPQLKPALATLGMLTFMFHWNAYLWPLIVLTEQDKRTLPIILTWYETQHTAQPNLVMAASVLMVIPVLIVFGLSQRWIVRGLTLTGTK
ncbi:MAG TPA: carbohydrate ABC transporter permease [Actinomycetota bacterium]|nr:carbohydrate ABC transporter permease [Actinomycetota bacterium]